MLLIYSSDKGANVHFNGLKSEYEATAKTHWIIGT